MKTKISHHNLLLHIFYGSIIALLAIGMFLDYQTINKNEATEKKDTYLNCNFNDEAATNFSITINNSAKIVSFSLWDRITLDSFTDTVIRFHWNLGENDTQSVMELNRLSGQFSIDFQENTFTGICLKTLPVF